MRCRHFTLRLTEQHAQADETRLNDFLQSVQVQTVQSSSSAPGCWSIIVFYDEPAARTLPGSGQVRAGAPQTEEAPLSPEQQRIYERLREWRGQRAASEGKPPYIIAHNAVLAQIARQHMSIQVADDLAGIGRFGAARAARYGPDILRLLGASGDPDGASLWEDER